jgi:hypothetical protein
MRKLKPLELIDHWIKPLIRHIPIVRVPYFNYSQRYSQYLDERDDEREMGIDIIEAKLKRPLGCKESESMYRRDMLSGWLYHEHESHTRHQCYDNPELIANVEAYWHYYEGDDEWRGEGYLAIIYFYGYKKGCCGLRIDNSDEIKFRTLWDAMLHGYAVGRLLQETVYKNDKP